MSNIKWSGIEQWKYGLTARWYVSAYYGNDTDVDAVGLYDPNTNPTGHGGKERPFASLDRAFQESSGNIVLDSGYYTSELTTVRALTGDGNVVIGNKPPATSSSPSYNLTVVGSGLLAGVNPVIIDCTCIYST